MNNSPRIFFKETVNHPIVVLYFSYTVFNFKDILKHLMKFHVVFSDMTFQRDLSVLPIFIMQFYCNSRKSITNSFHIFWKIESICHSFF